MRRSEYDAKSILKHPWAPLEHLPDGRWRRAWTIVLKEAIPSQIELEELSAIITQDIVVYMARDSRIPSLEGDLVIMLRPLNQQTINAIFTTRRDGWSDELFFATYRLFLDIDQKIGTIDTIEGYARDSWPLQMGELGRTKDTSDS